MSALGDVQESPNGTTINVFDVRLMVQFRVDLIDTPRIAPKGAF